MQGTPAGSTGWQVGNCWAGLVPALHVLHMIMIDLYAFSDMFAYNVHGFEKMLV